MLLPNPYGRGRWRTMLKIRKMDGNFLDLVQIVLNRESFFSMYGVDLYHLLAELNCFNCFCTTETKIRYIALYRNQVQSSDKDLILTLTEESCMKVSKQYP